MRIAGDLGAKKGRQPGFFSGGEDSRQDEGFPGVWGDKEARPEEVPEEGFPRGAGGIL
jgi:hypothetical protein